MSAAAAMESANTGSIVARHKKIFTPGLRRRIQLARDDSFVFH
jgi:hypothetical protein